MYMFSDKISNIVSLILVMGGLLLILLTSTNSSLNSSSTIVSSSTMENEENSINPAPKIQLVENTVTSPSIDSLLHEIKDHATYSGQGYTFIFVIRPAYCSLCIAEVSEYIDIIDNSYSEYVSHYIVLTGSGDSDFKKRFSDQLELPSTFLLDFNSDDDFFYGDRLLIYNDLYNLLTHYINLYPSALTDFKEKQELIELLVSQHGTKSLEQ